MGLRFFARPSLGTVLVIASLMMKQAAAFGQKTERERRETTVAPYSVCSSLSLLRFRSKRTNSRIEKKNESFFHFWTTTTTTTMGCQRTSGSEQRPTWEINHPLWTVLSRRKVIIQRNKERAREESERRERREMRKRGEILKRWFPTG
ncbi:MAG: hypothetical protein BYD32DRAFT_36196 [Podila humilis]|nr:MAG: hypothetical protein BYD32DRAFT_36196 [Podila humilis]